ncbi:Hypothetical predicted protein, partial [Marmota monax]
RRWRWQPRWKRAGEPEPAARDAQRGALHRHAAAQPLHLPAQLGPRWLRPWGSRYSSDSRPPPPPAFRCSAARVPPPPPHKLTRARAHTHTYTRTHAHTHIHTHSLTRQRAAGRSMDRFPWFP